MKKFLEIGNRYCKESDWKDLALIKFCLCAIGIMIGTQTAPKHKKAVMGAAAGVFLATYIPLMTKLFKIVKRERAEAQDAELPEDYTAD